MGKMAQAVNKYILDVDYDMVGLIDDYISFSWCDRYNSTGDLYIETLATNRMFELLKNNYFVQMDNNDGLMIIEKVELQTSIEDGLKLIATGRSLESILERRIIWKQTTIKGTLEAAIEKLLNENAIECTDKPIRQMPLVFDPSEDEEISSIEITEAQYTGDNLYTVISNLCDQYDIGFKITFDFETLKYHFKLYKGTDRSYAQDELPYVIFGPDFGNVINSNYSEDETNYRNIALVAGEGEGNARKTEIAGDDTLTGIERKELYVDARDISTNSGAISLAKYKEALKARGEEKLSTENGHSTFFDCEVDDDGMYQYKRDFFMGDIVEFENEVDIKRRSRVIEYYYIEENGGVNSYPSFKVLDEEEESEDGE